ncbi:alkaline phosphatase family protein [Cerasicoccus arenae]|uniref:Alkaline phosphatase family protein n=1 Tax=Cerasicoccus arenae TaxID=424488 RepID=A0A8J3DKR9_9BACT|nr:nucleotide pyrophosphatase/phosphodiesterase family protein [Cerasicoccus arenae]MBK1857835.1 alkaline phosphatase family protein [Cerasicoccus arenae]GHC11588.1 alkaline phosphatase family protein [Cerasicoccus arenae]
MARLRTAILNVVGLSQRHLGEHTPNLQRLAERNAVAAVAPTLPAVTCSAQATYLTGELPSKHGIVANGWYDRELAEHLFWKQSNHLMQGPKLWDILRRDRPETTVAQLFWWFNMYADVNFAITPRPLYLADGGKHFDIHTTPLDLREMIKGDLGEFPFRQFWGPASGIESSLWIAKSAQWTEEKRSPDCSLVYLPHLDYCMMKLGPDHASILNELAAIDRVVGELIDFYESRGVQVVVLSEYGITPVSRPVHLNRLFRERGWLSIKDELGTETLDKGACRAFVIADHQCAHIYVPDASIISEVRTLLDNTPGVGEVLDAAGKARVGLDHPRSGDLVVFAEPDAWFTYYYWLDDARAPDFARTVDIHRKPGFDPVELFIDPAIVFPKLKLAGKLLRKKIGLRTLFDVIPLDASLVKGSHGHRPLDPLDWPLLIAPSNRLGGASITATDVHRCLVEVCQG